MAYNSRPQNRMRVAIIGRSELLYDTALKLKESGFIITCILTAKEAPEYMRTSKHYEDLSKKWGIPFMQSVNIAECRNFLINSQSDIAVSINYSGIIPQNIIDLFKLGILNAHGGDLPRYRGNACQAWAILNGEPRIGLCIHKMIGEELDSGDIIARDFLDIDDTTKVTEIWDWMHKRVPQLCLNAMKRLTTDANYILEAQSKDPTDALRCYPRKPQDGKIDWKQSALQILRLINASNKPYSGAFCNFDGRQFIIWSAEVVLNYENFVAIPGQVTKIDDDNIEVACGEGKLKILMAEFEGNVGLPSSWIKSIRQRLS
jgi:methionyl-tRNA formyltransferase